jgi:phosphoglycerate dehydrogenase-like enzyme
VEDYLPMMTGGTLWSRADGVQAELVAEHALMLTLTVRRGATACTRYRRWVPRTATSLHGADVVVVGGGAVARALLRLLEPFGVRVTVLSRSGVARGHGARIRSVDGIDEHLSAADVLILAAPLTARTVGLIDGARLALLRPGACVVNVGRGGLVVTDDLVAALATGRINAGLDVTDPEPLPVGHPLWDLPNCTVTAHHAGDFAGSEGAFADLVAENVRRWAAGRPPRGLVDAELGY